MCQTNLVSYQLGSNCHSPARTRKVVALFRIALEVARHADEAAASRAAAAGAAATSTAAAAAAAAKKKRLWRRKARRRYIMMPHDAA